MAAGICYKELNVSGRIERKQKQYALHAKLNTARKIARDYEFLLTLKNNAWYRGLKGLGRKRKQHT